MYYSYSEWERLKIDSLQPTKTRRDLSVLFSSTWFYWEKLTSYSIQGLIQIVLLLFYFWVNAAVVLCQENHFFQLKMKE